MQAKFTRLYTDEHGVSRFEDGTTPLQPGFAIPPAEPLHTAPFLPGVGTIWVGAPADWRGDAPHPAPRRMIFVTVQGSYEMTAGDQTRRRFPPGSVLIIEDTSGSGHSTRLDGEEEVIVLAVGLPDNEQC